MQHPSSILPWWLCRVIHIKTASLSEKYPALPSKWKCISITRALFFHFIYVCRSFHFVCLRLLHHQCYIFPSEDVRCVLLLLNNHSFNATNKSVLTAFILPTKKLCWPEMEQINSSSQSVWYFFNLKGLLGNCKVACVIPALVRNIWWSNKMA